jgi:hypothetical protein
MARLQRQVDLRQQVYVALAQSYEQARIDEVRTTPVVTVVEAPETFVQRAPGNVITVGILALIVGLVLAAAWAFLADILRRQRELHPEHYAEFRQLRGRLFRRLRRDVAGGGAAGPPSRQAAAMAGDAPGTLAEEADLAPSAAWPADRSG